MEIKKDYMDEAENNVDFRELAKLFFLNWRWFAFSIIFCIAIATYYVVSTIPTYTRSETIGFKDINDKSSMNVGLSNSTLADFGIIQPAKNIQDEIITLSAPNMMQEVVRRLNLETQIRIKKGLQTKLLYKNSPIKITFKDINEDQFISLNVRVLSNQTIELTNFLFKDKEFDNVTFKTSFNQEIKTPIGHIVIEKTPFYTNEYLNNYLYVTKFPIAALGNNFSNHFNVSRVNKESTMLSLSISDENTLRAEDILKTIVKVYNEKWIEEKNQVAINTSEFINSRLDTIQTELKYVDQNISDFKSKNLIPDLAIASTSFITKSTENEKEIFRLNTQFSMAKFLKQYLNDESKKDIPLPANIGLIQTGIDAQIDKYNTVLIKRNNLIDNSGELNPLVSEMDLTLAGFRSSILQSVDNTILILKKQIKSAEEKEEETNTQIASSPIQAKQLLSIERQQKVKEALYIFLLQKREENELSKAYTVPNSKIVQPPIGPNAPSTPKKKQIFLIALMLGILIPGVILFLFENFNTSIRGRQDIEHLNLPFIGDIPYYESEEHKKNKKQSILSFFKKEKKLHFGNLLLVKPNNNNIINEAFRIARTKLDFTLSQSNNKIILITSFNPGSGKTFISHNLATCMSFMKKTIVIDLDLRRATLSNYYKKSKKTKGLSSYLNGDINDYKEIIINKEENPNLDIIPVGIIPPNPSELLTSKRLENLLQELSQEYEYIFLDTPPLELIADTEIIQHYADLTLFVIRAGVMDRRALPEIAAMEQASGNRYAILLNGARPTSYQKGYRYSYKYGRYGGYYSHYGHYNYSKDA